MPSSSPVKPESKRCASHTDEVAIHLDVLDARSVKDKVRPSRMSPRRAIVLGIIQALIVVHVLVWWLSGKYGWFDGYTLTPIEPSEAMQTLELGRINAGFLFFALALLSTIIFGRFFCGWGCHVVMLQDLCGWMMKKVGIRPKPFRSRLLVWFPLILALYMFVWPNFKRFIWLPVLEAAAPGLLSWFKPVAPVQPWEWHLTTADFWATFPGWAIAVPFLFICGFGTVYFLGSKGFCTYGCPYGGFFALTDQVSPGRIVVNDDCEGCGHCTARCTSNVRVHEEVREYGMVVDPGCMKCMDCVSVCPNDALSFSFARPSIAKPAAKNRPPKRTYDLSGREEVALAVVFLWIFVVTRGLYGVVPLLMAAGIAGCATFLLWKSWRCMKDAAVRFHGFTLRRDNRLTLTGYGWVTLTAIMSAFLIQGTLVQYHEFWGDRYYARLTLPLDALFNPNIVPNETDRYNAAYALAHFQRADSISDGGFGLVSTADLESRLAYVHLHRGEYRDAYACIEQVIDKSGPSDTSAAVLGRTLIMMDRVEEARRYWKQILIDNPDFELVRGQLDRLNALMGTTPDAPPGP